MSARRIVWAIGMGLLLAGLMPGGVASGDAWGDVDGDGTLTVLDVRLCHQICLEIIPCPGDCAELDVTGDGIFDDDDCLTIAIELIIYPPAPEIDVQRPAGTSVPDGGTDAVGTYYPPGTATVDLRYTIENTSATALLRVLAVSASNLSNCSGFTVATDFPLSVPADGSATLDVSFDVEGGGPFSLDLEITNNDPNENPYDIHITGRRCHLVVSFDDPGLEAAVREAVGKPAGPLYDCDVEPLTYLDASNRGISDLTGIDQLIGLQTLELQKNTITDIGPLSGLPNLHRLWLFENAIADIGPLAGMVNLRVLHLGGNAITTIGDLAGLVELTDLSLWWNLIADFGPLASLIGLQYLDLEDTGIADISALAGLTGLRTLYLGHNFITDIGPLRDLTNLEKLDLAGNRGIGDIGVLAFLTRLERLYIDWIGTADISPLAKLVELVSLDLGHNGIVDIDALAGLTALERLLLDDNQIEDIDALAGLTALTRLDLDHNQIIEINALVANSAAGGLGPGDDVDLQSNPLTAPTVCDDVDTLRSNGVTVQLSVGVCP